MIKRTDETASLIGQAVYFEDSRLGIIVDAYTGKVFWSKDKETIVKLHNGGCLAALDKNDKFTIRKE